MVRMRRGVVLSSTKERSKKKVIHPKPKEKEASKSIQAKNTAAATLGLDPATPSSTQPLYSPKRPSLPLGYKPATKELTVICWKWQQNQYRSKFGPEQVHILKNMLEKNLQIPHRFVCITDSTHGLDGIETMPLWEFPQIDVRQGKPNCYRRLKAFDKSAAQWLGSRIMSIDLDVVITGDITEIVDRPNDDFIIWGDTAKNTAYNGGFWLMDAGARSQVYEKFTPDAPRITAEKRMVGSDQAWISYVLGPNEKKWTTADGIYSFRNHMSTKTKPGAPRKQVSLPDDARIVFFHGHYDPWDTKIQRQHPWVKEFYC